MNWPRSIRFLYTVILLTGSTTYAQLQPQNTTIVWRGFEHEWTYNHRCNRLGDFVTCNDGKPQAGHISATGLGADSTYFNSYYTLVSSPDLSFKEGVSNIRIKTMEKQLAEGTYDVFVPCDDRLKNRDHYSTFLNGFTVRSERAPDKIQLLRLHVEDPVYVPADNQLKFTINYSFVFNCQSVECPQVTDKVDYELTVYYLIAAYDEANATVSQYFFSNSYIWTRKEDLGPGPEQKMACGVADPKFKKAFTGIKAMSLVLNEAHWLGGFNSSVLQTAYDTVTGCAQLEVDLLFKEWHEGMKKSEAAPGQSRFSAKRPGWAMQDINVAVVQIKNGNVNNGTRSGKMFWKGKTRRPGEETYESIIPISLE